MISSRWDRVRICRGRKTAVLLLQKMRMRESADYVNTYKILHHPSPLFNHASLTVAGIPRGARSAFRRSKISGWLHCTTFIYFILPCFLPHGESSDHSHGRDLQCKLPQTQDIDRKFATQNPNGRKHVPRSLENVSRDSHPTKDHRGAWPRVGFTHASTREGLIWSDFWS